MTLQIHQFPCLSDNYGFLVHDPASGETTCIDTPDAQAYLREAAAQGWNITQIWNTHWHPDHAGGNEAIKAAAKGRLKGILGYTDQPNVSSDFNHDPHSSIFHLDQTKVMDGTMVRILTWYDNEWGFSNRMLDVAVLMGKSGS